MIYLIGGAPRLGKSIMARKLMEKIHTPWLSVDVLRTVVAETIQDTNQRKRLFPFVEEDNNDKLFQIPTNSLVEMQMTEGESMWSAISSFIRHQIAVKNDFILEGVYLLPDKIDKIMSEKQYQKNVKAIFIIASDEKMVLNGFRSNTSHHDWLEGTSDITKKAVAQFVIGVSEKFRISASRIGMQFFERTHDFQSDVENIIAKLLH